MTVILTILTDPPGCQVLINGEAKGVTNSEGKLVLAKVPLAHYDVEARKDGFSSMKKGFQAGTESPTLVFKLQANLDNEVNQFNELVASAKLTGPESPNAFDLLSDLSAKYPDRAEVATMRSSLLPGLTEIADAAVSATLSKWRGVSRAEIERGQTASECIAKLKSDDNRAAARVPYLKGVLAMRDWLIGASGQNSATQNKTPADFLGQARDNLGNAVQLDGSWAAANYQLGRLLLFSENADAAQSSFIKTTQLQPTWGAGHTGLADAYYAAGKRKESIAEYQKALKLDPSSARAYAGLGLARCSTGESKDGLKDIERAIQLDPSSGLPHLNLAAFYAESKKKKDREKALEELNEAIKRNPDNLEFRKEVAAHLVAGIKERDKK
jgi:tetratricopeptide (TPR) repeat protein